MHVINFLVAIFLPFVSLLNKFRPPDVVPIYFDSPEAAFIAGEFCAVVFFWAGFWRNLVRSGKITERHYFLLTFAILVFMCASKIIFVLPFTWIISMFAFGLGVLATPSGQGVAKKSLWLIILMSIIIVGYSSFILIGLAWFNFNNTDYYYYQLLIEQSIEDFFHSL